MRYSLGALALSAGASALAVERACTFTLASSGGVTGPVGQLNDGQIRVGSGLPVALTSFSINNGQITNSAGSGCILTPPTTQFQCDVGATPTGDFSIGANGLLSHSGSSTFYACPASDNEYNFYTTPVAGQAKCVEVQLTASGCFAASTPKQSTVVVKTTVAPPAASAPAAPAAPKTVTQIISNCAAAPTVTVTQAGSPAAPVTETKTVTVVQNAAPPQAPAASTPVVASVKTTATAAPAAPASSSCPANLNGNYQYPHLIVPVDSTKPDTAAGTSYNGVISSTVSSIFNFDIPTSYTGTCSLVFLFPKQADLETSSFTFSGSGSVDFSQLSNVASSSTTYANQGSGKDLGTYTVTPGSSTVISTFACPAGQAVSYELKAAADTSLTYFQDYNPSPIGLYVRAC